MAKGETVKYIIDADVSAFIRGLLEADVAAKASSKSIDKSISTTARRTSNNFNDIRNDAKRTSGSIRAFGTALSGFNTTSAIVGITALSGAILELSGAIAAAGSTASILAPALTQGLAAVTTFKTGIAGLSDAFKAIGKNDGKAFAQSLQNLGPAATQVAFAAAGINKAFNGIRLNVQQQLFAGLGDIILKLGASILPTLNAGMQEVAQSFNAAFKEAASLGDTPIFRGLVSTVFADTARNVQILSGALAPLLSIFTNLYLVTRPYVTLLATQFVNLVKQAAAYANSAKGQSALNLAIQEGLVAIEELGKLVSVVFGLLTSVFRTAVNAGNSLIPTLTGIVKKTEDWVNSAQGQKDLASLFNFTSLALQNVASSIGLASRLFFSIINLIDNLSPGVQTLVIQFLSLALALGPVGGYFIKLFGAIKLVGSVIVNLVQGLAVVFGLLGTVAGIALVLAGGLIILGAVIKGPLGGALIVIGSLLAAYIGLSFLLTSVNGAAATSFFDVGFAALAAADEEADLAAINVLTASTMYAVAAAGLEAAGGLEAGASGAELLQAALLPLLALAAGVLVILSILGVFSSKTKSAQGATTGFGSSLTSLQKALKGVNSSGTKTSDGGLSALNDSLNSVGDASAAATGSLASFDKMNVLTDNNAGISGIPSLPDLGGVGGGAVAAPTIDTTAFDKALDDMQKNFGSLSDQISKPIKNPFQSLADWIHTHPWVDLGILLGILVIIGAAFIIWGAAVFTVVSPLTLIVIGIAAIIAIAIILVKNWSVVWATIKNAAMDVWNWISQNWPLLLAILTGPIGLAVLTIVDNWQTIEKAFSDALTFIENVWSSVVSFFQGVWDGIVGVFSSVGSWFGNVFSGAWTAVMNAFGAVGNFFSGVWDTIKGVFTDIGTTIGTAVEDAFKSVLNGVLAAAQTVINAPIDTIDSLIGKINSIPGVPNIPKIPEVTLPRLATGGIITSPTVAQLGENGQEAIMPLQNNTEWIDKLADKINASNGNNAKSSDNHVASRLNNPQQGNNITIQVSGVFATSVSEQRKVADLISKRINESMGAKTAGAF